MKVRSNLPEMDLKNKRVLVRADLNSARNQHGEITHDFRLKEILPTLNLIREKGGRIILLTHYGRPKKPTPELSTVIFIPWFKKMGYKALFAPTLEIAKELGKDEKNQLILVENLRFFPGEQTQDTVFAKNLSQLGDYYINDAFGVCHRTDTSVTLLANEFSPKNRSVGLLVEKEIAVLNRLIENIKHPFVIVQGGIKGETKLPMLNALLHTLDAVLLSTPLCFTFLKALGKPVGKSFTEIQILSDAKKFLDKAKEKKIPVIFPVDYQATLNSFEKPYGLLETKILGPEQTGVSIGPETVKIFGNYLRKARTIFLNGVPGNINYQETIEGTRILLSIIQQTNATCVVAGGDSVALIQKLGFGTIGHFSTGGGATLSYLSGQPLPGLAPFAQ